MQITTSGNMAVITGNIKSVSDFQEIKNSLDMLKTNNSTIIVEVKDSISITSSVIGYLNKLVLKDKKTLQLKVGNSQLLELLDDLNLTQVFHAKKA